MSNELLESLKNKTREERRTFFKENKVELLESALQSVNGGYDEMPEEYRNPNSDCPDYFGSWESSWYFICEGKEVCS